MRHEIQPLHARRSLLGAAIAASAGVILPARAAREPSAHSPPENERHQGEEEVSPAEDLMREHGVLTRILIIYRESIRRLDETPAADLPAEAIAKAAGIVREFVEDYHEKLEEDELFPRFRTAGVLVELADVLEQQHDAGRRLTDVALSLANAAALRKPDERRRLSDSLAAFARMYEPHAAREDTVLFPALRRIVTPNEYGALGEDFEKKEHQLFGEDGFDAMVDRVAAIEKSLGLYELSQFTPRT